jgi:transposase-like protein
MKHPKIDPETTMAAVLEGLRGESSIADICRKYQISESLYYRWRNKFLEGGSLGPPHDGWCYSLPYLQIQTSPHERTI